MSDLIDRQAAIDAIGEKNDEIFKTKQKGATYPHDDFFQGMTYAENVVKQLPSARSENVCCKDCKYNYGLTHGGEFNPEDIVCTFFDTDGMRYCDFCSYAERRTE